MSFEQRTIFNTLIGLCLSTVLALVKFVLGFFTDYNLISIAVYTFALLLAKLECVLGVRTDKKSFRTRNILTAVFLIISSVIYIGFMCRMFFIERSIKNNGMGYVLSLAFISFTELGFAIAGLIRTKDKGHYYRNIKIINFCIALIAILTTQMAILNMQVEGEVSIVNAYTGIGVGCFISLCAVYILVAPRTSIIDREHNAYVLTCAEKNKSVDMKGENFDFVLCKSYVYGDYIYRAKIRENTVDGDILRGESLWKRMHIALKILCCVLSEILIFVWLAGRGILFFRSINLPRRLDEKMRANGFEKLAESAAGV